MYILNLDGTILCTEYGYDACMNTFNDSFSMNQHMKILDASEIVPNVILHDMYKHRIILDPNYTFNSFVMMLRKYPLLKLLNPFIQSHLDELNNDPNFDTVVPGNKNHWGIFKVISITDLPYPESMFIDLRWFVDDYIVHGDKVINTWKEYNNFKRLHKLRYEWIQEYGYGMIGEYHWSKYNNFHICLMDTMHNNQIFNDPCITLYEFLTAILSNISCIYAYQIDDFVKSLVKSKEDKNIKSFTSVEEFFKDLKNPKN